MMRQIFSLMEKTQEDLLRHLNLSSLDRRLPRARHHARDLFERTWALAERKGIVSGERGAALLYGYCLALALNLNGIEVPAQFLPDDGEMAGFLREASG